MYETIMLAMLSISVDRVATDAHDKSSDGFLDLPHSDGGFRQARRLKHVQRIETAHHLSEGLSKLYINFERRLTVASFDDL